MDSQTPKFQGSGKTKSAEGLLPLVVAIEVNGVDVAGRLFTQHAQTIAIGRKGCRFRLKTEVDFESILAIRVLTRATGFKNVETPELFEITEAEREKDGWVLSATALRPDGLAEVEFPDAQHCALLSE